MASKTKKPSSSKDGRVTQAPGSAFSEAARFLSNLFGITEPRGAREAEGKAAGQSLVRPGGNPFAIIDQQRRKIDAARAAAKKAAERNR